jgi:hypothetical protein
VLSVRRVHGLRPAVTAYTIDSSALRIAKGPPFTREVFSEVALAPQDVLPLPRTARPQLAREFGVTRLALLGSHVLVEVDPSIPPVLSMRV